MKAMFKTVLCTLILASISCATENGFVDYKDLGVYTHESAGNKKFEDVGPIKAEASGFVWDSCDKIAKQAVSTLKDIAVTRGGNTVYDIKYVSENGYTKTPTCTVRYGWFAAYVVPGLGPWMTVVEAEGIAAKIPETGAVKEMSAK